MKDLSSGSTTRHLIEMAVPIAVGLLVQTLYYLVDLYFVGKLGGAALAGVSLAGNVMFCVMAITQIIGVGAVALMSQAVGKKEHEQATRVFNQSMLLASVFAVLTVLAGYTLGSAYVRSIAADEATFIEGQRYLFWFIPCLAGQFAIVTMSSALRATGVVTPTMVVQLITVVINIILAPILIAGWGTGYPMGVAGAGLASTLSVVAGIAILWWYFNRREKYLKVVFSQWRMDLKLSRKIVAIGFPAGGEFALLFVYFAVIYWAVQVFGADSQAGFGLGSRILQAMFLPALAIAFAIPAVVGQNYGAGLAPRVRSTYKSGAWMTVTVMLVVTFMCQFWPVIFIAPFSDDVQVVEVGSTFLTIISWNFVFSGLIFVYSGMFQGFGNTWPSIISTGSRLITFVLPLVYLKGREDFAIEHIWYLSVVTVAFQCLLSYLFLRRELKLKVEPLEQSPQGV